MTKKLVLSLVAAALTTLSACANSDTDAVSYRNLIDPSPEAGGAEGLQTAASNHSALETLQRLRSEIESRGLTVIATYSHASAAEGVGLEMPYSTLLVFGNPAVGTPSMVEAPTLAIELPLKALVWESPKGKVMVSYNSADYLFNTIYTRHGATFAPAMQGNIEDLLADIVAKATE